MNQALFNINDIILILSAVEAWLLVIVIWALGQTHVTSRLILSGLLIILGFIAVFTLIIWSSALSDFPTLSSIAAMGLPLMLILRGPLLYLYMTSVLYRKHISYKKILPHAIPFFFVLGYVLIFPIDAQGLRMGHVEEEKQILHRFLWNVIKYTTLIYSIGICVVVHRYKKNITLFNMC